MTCTTSPGNLTNECGWDFLISQTPSKKKLITIAREKNIDNAAPQVLLDFSMPLDVSFDEALNSNGTRDFDFVAVISDSVVQLAGCTADLVGDIVPRSRA